MVSVFLLYHFGIGLNLFVKVFHVLNAMQLYPLWKQERGCITWRETRRKRHMNRAYCVSPCWWMFFPRPPLLGNARSLRYINDKKNVWNFKCRLWMESTLDQLVLFLNVLNTNKGDLTWLWNHQDWNQSPGLRTLIPALVSFSVLQHFIVSFTFTRTC